MALLLAAFFLLACRVSAGSCVSKPCGSDYQITYWNPIREYGELVYYYEIEADGCGVVFTDVLLQVSLTCKDCSTIKCYDSRWNQIRCNYPPAWVTSDAFFNSKGVSPTSGLKFTLPSSTSLRFSISSSLTTATEYTYIYTKGNSWSKCKVVGPVCNCCPPCPSKCYKPDPNNCRCNNCTDCVGNTYETSPCNGTQNRVCKNCTECVTNMTYETVPCTSTQNRVCNNCTQCVTNMTYETRPCNKTSNRICQNCTQCVTSTQYEVRPCNQTSNRVCQNCTQCVTNMTYEVRPCNRTSNRVCQNCTQCVTSTQYEVRPCNQTSNRVCQDCTQCVTNMTYETVPCNRTTNRVCNDCTQCVTNMTYETVPCNRTTNRVCRDCQVCVTNTTYEAAPCTTTSNRVCNNCTTCIPGQTYENRTCSQFSDRVCIPCTNCTAGFWQETPCNATHDAVCRPCSNCTANEQVAFPCNATHDVVCEPCPECANCTDPNSHLTNNGLNCTCNDGYMPDPFSETFTCVLTPCCANCFACDFNRSVTCLLNDNSLCDWSCKLAPQCVATTPADTGYTVNYLGVTVDGACCGPSGGDCTCFTYQLGASVFPLDDFILGLTCDNLFQCDGLSPPPCFDSVQVDGGVATPFVFITTSADANPVMGNLFGISLTGLGLNGDAGTYTFLFQGHINESSIPLPFAAGAPDPNNQENRACYIDSIGGPACVNCDANPDILQSMHRKNLMSLAQKEESEKMNNEAKTVNENSGYANGNLMAFMILMVINLVALTAARN